MPDTAKSICEKAMKKNRHYVELSAGWPSTSTTFEDQTCTAFYDEARRSTLRMAAWTCCIKRATLTAVDDPDPDNLTGKTYTFDLPADYLRKVGAEDGYGNPIDFLIEGARGYSDTEEPVLVYVFDQTDPTKWDDLLKDAIILMVAMLIAYPLTASHENEEGFIGQATAIAEQAEDESRRERRTPNPNTKSREWHSGLFSNRRGG